jgi:hypothetical protein
MTVHTWTLWYPKAASTGLLFARARIDYTEEVLVHAAPEYLTVEVENDYRGLVAFGQDLKRAQESPMTRLRRAGDTITREDVWPTDGDLGTVVILPGGEAGILKAWWHAEDHREWRWQVELHNRIP